MQQYLFIAATFIVGFMAGYSCAQHKISKKIRELREDFIGLREACQDAGYVADGKHPMRDALMEIDGRETKS